MQFYYQLFLPDGTLYLQSNPIFPSFWEAKTEGSSVAEEFEEALKVRVLPVRN